MDKEKLYAQIEEFNETRTNPEMPNSKKYQEAFYYLSRPQALERANFFKFLLTQEPLRAIAPDKWKILDLAFGSGNLISHLIAENDLDYNSLVLNDKITENSNQALTSVIEDAQILSLDFLKKEEFQNDNFNLVVFNPQIGGANQYPKGDSKLKKTPSKNNEALKATFEKVFDSHGILIFYGEEDVYKMLFVDFSYTAILCSPDDGKNLFVATKALEMKAGAENQMVYYKKQGDSYEVSPNGCKGEMVNPLAGLKLGDVENQITENLQHLGESDHVNKIFTKTPSPMQQPTKLPETTKSHKEPFVVSATKKGNLDFLYKNLLLKGVPGTGKSFKIDEIIDKELFPGGRIQKNILRINVHSGSSNADLMQGIGISTNNKGEIQYGEKTGLILKHLKDAIAHPYQPFVIVLEEIQENSLNELIGDLIYLIEGEKRAELLDKKNLGKFTEDHERESFEAFLEGLIKKNSKLHFVKIPYLVSQDETAYRKMIVPGNLYLFCTSNYRDDKKIVEDNLMRRFELVELYPQYAEGFDKPEVATFLQKLNEAICEVLDTHEMHPDRFMIGHANWLKVKNQEDFCRALLKVLVEFKDIREVNASEWNEIIGKLEEEDFPFGLKKEDCLKEGYRASIEVLQLKAYGGLFS